MAYEIGTRVEVFSRRIGGWMIGHVENQEPEGFVTVQFGMFPFVYRKTLRPDSKHVRLIDEYDPKSDFVAVGSALSGLDDFVITFPGVKTTFGIHTGLMWSNLFGSKSKSGRIAEIMNLEHKRNYAFSTKCQAAERSTSFEGSFSIAYKPKCRDAQNFIWGDLDDKVLKVYALPASDPDEEDRYRPVGPIFFVHTLLHKQDEEVYFEPGISGPFFLGFTLHKDLSTDLRRVMLSSLDQELYFEGLMERFKRTWYERSDAEGETFAQDADYLISYTGHDKDENEKLLSFLVKEGCAGPHNNYDRANPCPIKFCTDRSLAYGVHFFQRGGSLTDEEGFTLRLGKHGFGQPLQDGTWWDDYRRAAIGKDDQGSGATKYGILVLNLTRNYLNSAACRKEFAEIPFHRIWVLIEFKLASPYQPEIRSLESALHMQLGGREARQIQMASLGMVDRFQALADQYLHQTGSVGPQVIAEAAVASGHRGLMSKAVECFQSVVAQDALVEVVSASENAARVAARVAAIRALVEVASASEDAALIRQALHTMREALLNDQSDSVRFAAVSKIAQVAVDSNINDFRQFATSALKHATTKDFTKKLQPGNLLSFKEFTAQAISHCIEGKAQTKFLLQRLAEDPCLKQFRNMRLQLAGHMFTYDRLEFWKLCPTVPEDIRMDLIQFGSIKAECTGKASISADEFEETWYYDIQTCEDWQSEYSNNGDKDELAKIVQLLQCAVDSSLYNDYDNR